MLDETIGRSQVGDDLNRFMVTAKLSIRYRKPVPTGQPLRILGHAGTRRGREANATGEIFGPDGTLLAQADAVLVDMPERALQRMDADQLGWKIYPDEEAGLPAPAKGGSQ
jgi:acyl-CoA thioesterase FadM